MKGVLLCILLCLLVAPSFQYGILRVEEIWSNLDTNNVVIEDIIIQESEVKVDYLHDLSGDGVWIEGVTFQDGSINIPGDLTTSSGIKFFRALYTNGGVFMDAGLENPDVFSFTIEDDTGNTFIAGVVRAQQGIDVEDGKFHTEGISGDTTIGPALIRPNGGIVTEEGDDIVFSADTAGNIFTAGDAYFGDDVYFGTNDQSDRTITRFATELASGGATYFCGQNADAIGGDLYLQPGLGANFNGIIQFGDSSNADLFVGRPTLSNGVNGGTFTIAGQNSLYGDGGDLWLSAGSSFFEDDTDGGGVSTEDDFDGGSIYIAPGIPNGAGLVGKLIVGSTGRNTSGFDLVFGRPALDFGDGADTFLAGQTTKVGIGGNFYLQAGSVRAGIGAPGDLILSPGDSLNRLQGNVYLGRAVATDLVITRVPVAGAAGVTKLISQSGLAGKGGPLVVSGGDAGGDFGAGGNLWIQPGSSSTGEAGKIIWGRDDDSLEVLRIPTAGFGLDTVFSGQSSNAGAGGDFTLRAGQGHGDGGDLVIESGFADGAAAGDILLSAGDSVTSYGGDVYIEAGASNRVPGSVVITAGRSTNAAGGSVVFNAGSGSVNGDILLGVGGNSVQALGVPVFVRSGILNLGAGNDAVTVNSNNISAGIIFWNGVALIRTPPVAPAVPVLGTGLTTTDIQNVATSLSGLVNAFAPCRGGHNLITLVDQFNNLIC